MIISQFIDQLLNHLEKITSSD
ncbi:hypothetical protein ACQCPP_30895 (plasmid) [Priestia megaterium]